MNGGTGQLIDQLQCEGMFLEIDRAAVVLILPRAHKGTRPTPWVWYAPTFRDQLPGSRHAWMAQRFLDKGIAIAGVDVGESFGNPQGRAVYTAFYKTVRAEHGLTEQACLMPQSRGGLMLYNWAAENPQCVACIAGIYTVCDMRSWPGLEGACDAYGITEGELAACLPDHNPIDRLAPLADAGVPILHIHGDMDEAVPLEQNSAELARRYRQLGGSMELIVVPGKGHEEVDEFYQCQQLVDFVIEHAR